MKYDKNSPSVTRTMLDLLAYLDARPNRTCTEIGEYLWAGRRGVNRQSWARAAGALVKRAKDQGWLIERRTRETIYHRRGGARYDYRREFRLTTLGREVLKGSIPNK